MSHDESQLIGVFLGAPVNGIFLSLFLYFIFTEVSSEALGASEGKNHERYEDCPWVRTKQFPLGVET